jgi:hypothetical protein
LLRAIPFQQATVIAMMLLCTRPLFGKRKDDVVIMENGRQIYWRD